MFWAYYSEHYNFVICLNGKVASTRCKEWFLKIHQLESVNEKYKLSYDPQKSWSISVIHNNVMNGVYCITKQEIKKLQVTRNLKVVVVTRHPLDRLVSFYFYWVVSNRYNQEGLTRNHSFLDCVQRLEQDGFHDAHTRLQTEELEGLRFDAIVDIQDLINLDTVLRIRSYLPGYLQTDSFFKIKTNGCRYSIGENRMSEPWLLTGHQWVENKDCYPADQMVNSELRQRVHQLYAQDFELLAIYQ